ncbi:hypothetical protein [Lacimicrobium alkaliphilum]|uniref:Arc-like DNA binding domain-containing protein n=1 Tax=Lacimicrobium alkaliphilum TaxID=1526571 RepID=A0ABQ1R7B6_9ALTE|nr:hypothetical protein [Lacimicrobium alkaliphilum]GGD60999.1 hypothetical protein GCM10011357_15360 [Lacimicrobium alkaliphilum]
MSKKAYPLRINADVLAAMQRWADDELRSVNAQIEYVLREALVQQGRVKLIQRVVTEIQTPETERDGDNGTAIE